MTAFQRILINTERWNETVVTPSLAKPHELICTPIINSSIKNITSLIFRNRTCTFRIPHNLSLDMNHPWVNIKIQHHTKAVQKHPVTYNCIFHFKNVTRS